MDNEWQGVPESAQQHWNAAFAALREPVNLRERCPICGATELHRWYYRDKPAKRLIEGQLYDARGGLWEWCSNCRTYAHYSALVPAWWSCDIDVPLSELRTTPDRIQQEIQQRGPDH